MQALASSQPCATDSATPATNRPAPAFRTMVSVIAPSSSPAKTCFRMAAFSAALPPLRSARVHLLNPRRNGLIVPMLTPAGVTVATVATAIGASSSRPVARGRMRAAVSTAARAASRAAARAASRAAARAAAVREAAAHRHSGRRVSSRRRAHTTRAPSATPSPRNTRL